jgi:hypothetical protein
MKPIKPDSSVKIFQETFIYLGIFFLGQAKDKSEGSQSSPHWSPRKVQCEQTNRSVLQNQSEGPHYSANWDRLLIERVFKRFRQMNGRNTEKWLSGTFPCTQATLCELNFHVFKVDSNLNFCKNLQCHFYKPFIHL